MATISSVYHGRAAAVGSWWSEYSGWVYAGGGLILAINLWPVFQAIGKAGSTFTDATLGKLTQKVEDNGDKARAKAAAGGKVDFTDSDIAQFRQDAQALAYNYGRTSGLHATDLIKNQEDNFAILKQRYSRVLLYNNLPMHRVNGKLVSQKVETRDSLKRAYNWRVLVDFYREASGGHDLRGDIMLYTSPGFKKKMLTDWIL